MDYAPIYRDIDTSEDSGGFVNHADFFGEEADFRATPDSMQQAALPEGAFARGLFKVRTLRTSVQCMACDLQTATDFETKGDYHTYLSIGMVISGVWASRISDDAGTDATCVPEVPMLIVTRRPIQFSMSQKAGRRVRMVGLCVGPEFFQSLGSDGAEVALETMVESAGTGYACRALDHSETLKVTLKRLYQNPYRGGLGAVYAESLVMLALVQAAAALGEPGVGDVPISTAHRDYAYDVRRMIDADIGRVPGIQRMSATLGIGETTLRRAFRDTFGMTIFEYVRDRRLETAQLLLRERRMHISQIAYSIGYSSLANFSNAYKRRFGYAPKMEA